VNPLPAIPVSPEPKNGGHCDICGGPRKGSLRVLAEFETVHHWFALCSGCANTVTLQADDVQAFMLRQALDALN
jgi:hypothetical protein